MGFFRFTPNDPPPRRVPIAAVKGRREGSQHRRPLVQAATRERPHVRPRAIADAAVPADRSVLRLFADIRHARRSSDHKMEKQAWLKLAHYLAAGPSPKQPLPRKRVNHQPLAKEQP
jgi:hypothetical protein